MARIDPTCALVLWDDRLALSGRAPNTGAALTSSYSEADKRPGLPVRVGRLTAQVSGDQDAAVTLQVSKNAPGLPGRQGVRVRASLDGGTTYLGHLRETEIRWWGIHPDAVGSGSESFTAIGATVTATGRPIVSYCSELDSVCSYWDGSDWVDSTGTDVNSDDHGERGVGLCVEPITGVIVMIRLDADNVLRTYHSTDDGVSFEIVATNSALTLGAAGYRIAMAANPSGILALIQTGGTAGDVYQIASSDLGVTWTEVDNASAEGLGWALTVVDGVFYSFSYHPSSGAIQMTRTTSPYESVPDATTTAITSRTGLIAITAWSDPAGILYCLICDNGVAAGDGPDGAMVPLVSYDGGSTWTEIQTSWASDATNVGPKKMVGVHTPYGVLVACGGRSPSDPTQDGSGHYMWLGGWSSREWNKSTISGTFRQTTGTPYGVLWLPFSRPGGSGFTVAGAGSDGLGIGWSCTDERNATLSAGPAQVSDVCFFDVQLFSGGSLTSLDIGFRATIGSSYEVAVRMATTGFRIYDTVAASTVDTVTVDMTERMQFLVNRSRLYYKRPSDLAWTSITISLTSGTPAGSRNSELVFGNFTGSTSSVWLGAGVSHVGFWDGVTGQENRGSHTPCYLPPAVGVPALLSLYDGPGLPDDTATYEPRSLYSIEHLDPVQHPSPATRWRSTQTANAEHIVWDLGDETELGRAVALVLVGTVRQARISYYDGSAWQTAGTADLSTGFNALSYQIAGDIMQPDVGGTDPAERYIAPGELVGGYVIVSGSPNTTHRILGNGGGLWADGAAVQPWLRLEDAASIPSTGMVTIVAPGGVVVVSSATPISARYWRIRFPAGQDCPDNRLEVGVAWMGRVVPMGAAPDWAWTDTTEAAIQRIVSPYGTARTRRTGPTRRVWTWSWADGGAHLWPLRANDATVMDGVGMAGAIGLTPAEDVWWTLTDILRTHQALPVVALRVVPAESGVTITDPSLWLYGYLDGSVAMRNNVGEEGEDELIRVDAITVREQV